MTKLEQRVPFLATTASITPFIGLFGTVWGIMASFQGIGAQGSTSLGVVAPGIAEALIATAAGLFAAIPAVYFYNHFTHRVKQFAAEMDDFSLEFLNISRAELHVGSRRPEPDAMPKVHDSDPKCERTRCRVTERPAADARARACRPRSPRSTSCRSST